MGLSNYNKEVIKRIKKSKVLFIMGHKNLDLDAIGSCIGMYSIGKKLKKECYIIVDEQDSEDGVKKVLHEIEGVYNVIKSNDIPIFLHKKNKKNLLIVVDTSKEKLFQSDKALEYFDDNILVYDHHIVDNDTYDNGLLVNDIEASSASEMVVNLSKELNQELEPYVATVLLAGITLDTNGFSLKTDADTFYTAYYLSEYGASSKKVQYLLKQDIEEYTEQQKLLTNIEKLNNIAIAKGTSNVKYTKADLARTADTLLYFNDIEASFTIGKIGKTTVGISGRSLGNYDISKILNKLNGGGSSLSGAAVFEDKTISEVYTLLKKAIKEGE